MLHGMLTALLRGLAVVLGVVTLTFFLLHLAPGDPVRRLLGPAAEPAQIEAARHTLGLDRPLPAQYLDWIGRAGRGDFGSSIAHGRPAAERMGLQLDRRCGRGFRPCSTRPCRSRPR